MKYQKTVEWILLLGMIALLVLPETASAGIIGGGDFENKMQNLQSKFINVLLPLMSIFGLVYAGILAASGKEDAKAKIVVVVMGSIVGFLAPHIIGWIQAALA